MIKSLIIRIIIALSCIMEGIAVEPVMKVLSMSEACTENLLQNGDLENVDGGMIHEWSQYRVRLYLVSIIEHARAWLAEERKLVGDDPLAAS